jgi:hypothetical protein
MMDLRRFSLKNSLWLAVLVYLIVLFIWLGLIVFFGSHKDSLLGATGMGRGARTNPSDFHVSSYSCIWRMALY